MSWHHEDCTGQCLACLIEALVLEHYGTQGLEFLRKKVSAGDTAALKQQCPDFLSQALNEGNGVYRP